MVSLSLQFGAHTEKKAFCDSLGKNNADINVFVNHFQHSMQPKQCDSSM